jgi:hypothetical protein
MMISSNAPPSTSCFTAANGSLSAMAPRRGHRRPGRATAGRARARSRPPRYPGPIRARHQQGKAAGGAAGTRTNLVQQPWRRRGSVSHHQDARRYRPGHPAIVSDRSCHDVDSGSVSRPTLSQLGASRAGETHRAERAYDHLNVLDAPHPWTVHRDRGAVAWRLNPQPAPRDHRGGATRRSRDRWRLLRLELLALLRVAAQRAASRAAPRPWAGIPRLRFARQGAAWSDVSRIYRLTRRGP